jgi:hypothetical protein
LKGYAISQTSFHPNTATATVYDFVLREGRFFQPRLRPESITLRHIGECFRNAFLTMMRTGLAYAEGYAVTGRKMPVLHAWNVDAEGYVIDSTWEPVGSIYFGIILPRSIVEPAKTSVLDDFENGWPVLRESWTEIMAEE